jgi:hypothetical protein
VAVLGGHAQQVEEDADGVDVDHAESLPVG